MATLLVPTERGDLKSKVELRTAKLGVIGLGYVGLPLALLFSRERFTVTGFDIDKKKVETLTQGSSYIHRVPVTEIQDAQAKGFTASSNFAQLNEMDAVLICVPTPLNEHREPDLSYITATAESIAPH